MSDRLDVAAAIEAAMSEVVRLCTPGERWRMSIPANPSRDSDLILMDALTAARDRIGELGFTRTEWRINGVDGEPSFAIDQRAPEAEYWTRKVAAMDSDRWPEYRTVTTYADHVTDWKRSEEATTADLRASETTEAEL